MWRPTLHNKVDRYVIHPPGSCTLPCYSVEGRCEQRSGRYRYHCTLHVTMPRRASHRMNMQPRVHRVVTKERDKRVREHGRTSTGRLHTRTEARQTKPEKKKPARDRQKRPQTEQESSEPEDRALYIWRTRRKTACHGECVRGLACCPANSRRAPEHLAGLCGCAHMLSKSAQTARALLRTLRRPASNL